MKWISEQALPAKQALFYDNDCPLCQQYVNKIRLDQALGAITFCNAREFPALNREFFKLGLDINQGMILTIDDEVYFGNEVIHRLALMTTDNTTFNRFNGWLFKKPALARCLYPVLVTGRRVLLFILRKKPIRF